MWPRVQLVTKNAKEVMTTPGLIGGSLSYVGGLAYQLYLSFGLDPPKNYAQMDQFVG